MSNVKQALSKLGYAVDNLESSLDSLEQAMTGKQRDMFAAPAASNGNAKQGALIAKRLDRTIEQVEMLLKEG